MISNTSILKDKIISEQKRLESEFFSLRAEGKEGAKQAMDALQRKLDELEDIVKDGWEQATDKLNDWLQRARDN